MALPLGLLRDGRFLLASRCLPDQRDRHERQEADAGEKDVVPGETVVLDHEPGHGAARKPAEPRPIPILRPRPEDAPSGTASIIEAYITGKGELRKMPQPIRMIQPSAPLLIKIMSKTVKAHPTARMPRDHLRPLWSETVPQKIWPTHPVMPEAPATTEAAASERPASLVSCSVRNEITPVSAHKNRKFATTESLTLRSVSASFIASQAVARGLSSRSSSRSSSVTEGVMSCSTIQAFTLLKFSRRASTICTTTTGIASNGMKRNTSRQVPTRSTAPIRTGPRNWPMGKPVWCVPTAKPRSSFCHHSPTIATLTGSIPPVPMPMVNRNICSCRSVCETAVATAEITTIATATAHVYARLTPFPRESPNTPRTMPPAIVPAKLRPTRTPPVVGLRLNSLRMPGKTVGRSTRSIEVMRMAPVVTASIHHESA